MTEEELSKSPVIRMAGSDGETYEATADMASEMSAAAWDEGIELKPFLKTKDAEGNVHEISPFDDAALKEAQDRGDERHFEGNVEEDYFSADALKAGAARFAIGLVNPWDWIRGIGTAAGTVARGLAKGTVGTAIKALRGATYFGESITNAKTGDDNHDLSDAIGKVDKGFDAVVDFLTPDLFKITGEYDGVEGAEEAAGKVRNVAEMVANVKGIGALTKGITATRVAKGVNAATAAREGHVITGALFGLGKYGEVASDPNGPGGARQQAAALAAGAADAVIFGLWNPFKISAKYAAELKPFMEQTRKEVTKRVLLKLGQMAESGAAMATVEGVRQGAEQLAGIGQKGEGTWGDRSWEDSLKEIGSQFIVGSAFAAMEVVEGLPERVAHWRARRAQDPNGQMKVAMNYQVEKARKTLCPARHQQAVYAYNRFQKQGGRAESFKEGLSFGEDVRRVNEDGGVVFDDGSVWRLDPARNGATITISDGTILDAKTGDLLGYRARQESGEADGGKAGTEARHPEDREARHSDERAASNAMVLLQQIDEGKLPIVQLDIAAIEGRAPTENGNEIGEWNPEKASPIVVLEDYEGNLRALTGGKRLVMAGASGAEKINAVVVKEADGWTAEMADGLGAIENMRQGNATLRNVVAACETLGAEQVQEIAGWHQAKGSQEFASKMRRGLSVAQKGGAELKAALAEGTVGEDFAYNAAQVLSMDRVGEGWETAQKALVDLAGRVGPEELDAVLWGLKRRITPGGAGESGRGIDWGAAIAEERAKYNAKNGAEEGKVDSDLVLIETGEGELKTLGEVEAGTEIAGAEANHPEGMAETAYAAAEGAAGNKAVELQAVSGREGVYTTLAFPDARLKVDGGNKTLGIDGLKIDDFSGANTERAAALVAKVEAFASENGLKIGFYDEDVMEAWRAMREQIKAEGEAAHARSEAEARRNTVLEQLQKSGLASEVVQSAEDFDRLFEELSGETLRSDEGVYGFVDPKTNKVYLNPAFFGTRQGLEAPIHEFWHLGVIAAEKVNKPVYDRGMKLATDFLEKPETAGEGPVRAIVDFILNNRVYSGQSREVQAQELLAQLIGKRGEEALRNEPNKSVVTKIKSWLVEFWNSFGKVLGLGEITPEQAAKMSLEDVADAIRAEMLSGRKYGESFAGVEFAGGGARTATRPRRLKRKLTGRRKAVNEFVREMGGGEDPTNRDVDLLALWVDNGGRLFDALPFEIDTHYSAGKTGVKKSRRSVADEFAESSAFYKGLNQAQRVVYFGTEKLETGSIGEGLKNRLEEAGITRFTREDGTVDFEGVISEFERQWSNYERGESFAKERREAEEEHDRAIVDQMEREEAAERQANDETSAAESSARAEAEAAGVLFSRGKVGTDNGVFTTKIDTKNPKTKDGKNTVIFRRSPTETASEVKNAPTLKAVESALPEGIKVGDKDVRYTPEERTRIRRFVKTAAKAQSGMVDNPEFGTIVIGHDFVREVQTHAISTAREIASVSSAREIAATMKHFAAAPNEEIKAGKNRYIEYGLAKFEFDGSTYLVMGEVGVRKNFTPYYDQRVVAKLKAETTSGDLHAVEKSEAPLSLHAGMELPSALDEIYDNRFRILLQGVGEFDAANGGAQGGIRPSRGRAPEVEYVKLTRVADDAGVGELTPGGIAASEELSRTAPTPLTARGTRYVALPLSEMNALARYLTGHATPAEMSTGRRLGVSGKASLKHRKIIIAADVLGTIDKTDLAAEKAMLKQHGFFAHEDPAWTANHSPAEVRRERERSEEALSSRLEKLADRRTRGVEAGGQAAGRKVFADQLAKIVMQMPHGQPGVLGQMQTVGGAIEKRVKGSDAEAEAFLDWMEGRGTGNGKQGTARSTQERKAGMFAAFLMMPKEMEARAKGWYDAIRSTIAGDQKLADAFRKMTARSMTAQGFGHLQAEIIKMQDAQTEAAIKKLRAEGEAPIKAGSAKDAAKETIVLSCDDRMGAAMVRVDAKLRMYQEAQKLAMKLAKTPAEKALIKQQTDIFMGEIAQAKNQVELSRTAWERGHNNEDARYLWRMVDLLNEATERDGLRTLDLSLYLDQERVIETKGLSGARGESTRQAQLILDAMRKRLGADFAKVEAFAAKFRAIHEQELLDDPVLERVLGKGTADYWRSQTHYVTTKRQFSPEELAEIEAARAQIRAATHLRQGYGGQDDVIGEMFKFTQSAGKGSGEKMAMAKLKGSFADKQEVMSATFEKVAAIKKFLRRSEYVIELRDLLLKAKVEGVHDYAAGKSEFPQNKRYGSISYMENGQRRTLVVPKEIADGFKAQGDYNNAALKLCGTVNNFARQLWIDWNPVYWQRNIGRNAGSIEMNMPGMKESVIKRGARFVFPGLAPVTEIAMTHLVRHLPEKMSLPLRKIWGEHTALFYAPKAKRMAMWLTEHNKMQQQLWEAERRGDLGKVQQMLEDQRDMLDALKANMLVGGSAGKMGGTTGFLDDSVRTVGKTMMRERQEFAAKSKVRRALDAVNIFKKNAEQQVFEDVLAKFSAYLHDRAQFGTGNNRTAAESGLVVKKNVSIGEGERKGQATRTIQALFQPFWNMVEKGVVRNVKAYGDRPGETFQKAAWRIAPMILHGLVGSGAIAAWILKSNDGDEEKAKSGPMGDIYRYARDMQRAYQNCSNYVRENYHVTPLMTDGYTSIVLGMPLTDEERLLKPIAQFVTDVASVAAGTKESLDVAKSVFDATAGVIAPDFKLAGALPTLLDDTVHALWENPKDYYTGGQKYDNDLWLLRNDSWGMRGKFLAAMGKRLWNDFGGRNVMPVDRAGVDNGLGRAPGWVSRMVNDIPVVSPILRSFIKVQVGSPKRDADEIVEADNRRRAACRIHAKELFEMARREKRDISMDRERYEGLLQKWQQSSERLSDEDLAYIESHYINAWNAYEGAQYRADGEREKYRAKAEKLGLDAAHLQLDFD